MAGPEHEQGPASWWPSSAWALLSEKGAPSAAARSAGATSRSPSSGSHALTRQAECWGADLEGVMHRPCRVPLKVAWCGPPKSHSCKGTLCAHVGDEMVEMAEEVLDTEEAGPTDAAAHTAASRSSPRTMSGLLFTHGLEGETAGLDERELLLTQAMSTFVRSLQQGLSLEVVLDDGKLLSTTLYLDSEVTQFVFHAVRPGAMGAATRPSRSAQSTLRLREILQVCGPEDPGDHGVAGCAADVRERCITLVLPGRFLTVAFRNKREREYFEACVRVLVVAQRGDISPPADALEDDTGTNPPAMVCAKPWWSTSTPRQGHPSPDPGPAYAAESQEEAAAAVRAAATRSGYDVSIETKAFATPRSEWAVICSPQVACYDYGGG